jgi:K+-transporting ATPase KdpF subunit
MEILMTFGVAFLLVVVLFTTVYLFYALLRPEKF